MSSRIPSSLKWLIDKRARIAGQIKFQRKNLDQIHKIIEKLQGHLDALDNTLELHDIKVCGDDIQDIRFTSKKRLVPYGKMTRLIYKYLGVSNEPKSTSDIAAYIFDHSNIKINNKQQYRDYKERTRYRLKSMRRQNKLTSPPCKIDGKTEAYWSLVMEQGIFSFYSISEYLT